jgi:hypothetical protein
MEYANIEIRLAGSLENTVIKEVSAPEIPVIKSVHGHDAVINIKKTRTTPVDLKVERDRLEQIYTAPLIDKLFPGVVSKLPTSLAEVGIEEPVVETSKKK